MDYGHLPVTTVEQLATAKRGEVFRVPVKQSWSTGLIALFPGDALYDACVAAEERGVKIELVVLP